MMDICRINISPLLIFLLIFVFGLDLGILFLCKE